MKVRGLRKSLLVKQLEYAKDKFSIFADKNRIYKSHFSDTELIELINEFLSDAQKAKLFELEYYNNLPSHLKSSIIESILDYGIKADLLENPSVIANLEFYEVSEIAKSLDDDNKIRVLNNPKFIQKAEKFSVPKIIQTLSEERKREILLDKSFVNQKLKLEDYQISAIVASLESDEVKREMIGFHGFDIHRTIDILMSLSDEGKNEIILKNEYRLDKDHLSLIISTLSTNGLVDFLRDNEEFLSQNGIPPYDVIMRLDKDRQLEFLSRIEDTKLSLGKKRQILVTLKDETKKEVDTTAFTEEYITAFQMQYEKGNVIADLNKNPEIYSDLGALVSINPMQAEDEEKLLRLLEVCPEISIKDELGIGTSTVEEYKSAEEWIREIIHKMNPEWTDIQKIAFIDNAIGKRVSYSPDYNTEIYDFEAARALWKIVCSGYGVCNGIAQLEQYILRKIGIEAEIVSSENHTFLKLKDIEIPNEDGSINRGDTILDPTWNLAANRYGAMPSNFCKSYEEMRKEDIDDDKNDLECHKNDEALSSAILSLDEKSLRNIFASIGVANKDGVFPIDALIEMSEILDSFNFLEESAIEKQFLLLAKYYPEFATCNNSTAKILRGVILQHKNLKYNRCVVNRVYERDDKDKRPVIYVYVDLPNAGKKFYFADKETSSFINLSQKEFEERFECYEMDMTELNGNRPWENIDIPKELENLAQSSGQVVAQEGEGR